MDKGKYTVKALSTKYDEFRGPAFTVKIDGTEYDSTEYPLADLEVDICADGSAGGCRFTIANQYDFAKTEWINNLAKKIKVGGKLEIQCGYVKKKEVFFGYVDECTVNFSSNDIGITVCGVDGLGFLMNCREPYYGGQKKPSRSWRRYLILISNQNKTFAAVLFASYFVRPLGNTYSIPCAFFLV